MRIGVKEPRVRFTPNKPNFISLSEIPLTVRGLGLGLGLGVRVRV